MRNQQTNSNKFMIKTITSYINKMHSAYLDIQFNTDFFENIKTDDPSINADYQYDIEETKQKFIYYYNNPLCIMI